MLNNIFDYDSDDSKLDETKLKEFGLKYDIWDDNKKEVLYSDALRLIYKYIYYNLENKYVDFITDFRIAHDIDDKNVPPARLNFRELKKHNNYKKSDNKKVLNITQSDIRKYKIDQALKNLEDDEEEEEI